MGRKSREQIKGESAQQEYIRYLALKTNSEYKSRYEKIRALETEIARIRRDYEKIPPRTSGKKSIPPDDPEYPNAIRRIELEKKLDQLIKEQRSFERILLEDFGLAVPVNPFEDEFNKEDFKDFHLFQDTEIVRELPCQEPQIVPDPDNPEINRIDFTDYLKSDPETGKPRYLYVEIDTWNKLETIVTALKERLDVLRKLGVTKFKSRLRKRSIDVEKVLQMRSQGMSNLRIMRELYQTDEHPAIDFEAERYYKRVKRASQVAKKKK
jgi:hypothetical protein